MIWTVVSQFILGVYLKLHLEKSFHGRIRPLLTKVHKVLGTSIPVIGYVQIVLGVIASLGFCYGGKRRKNSSIYSINSSNNIQPN